MLYGSELEIRVDLDDHRSDVLEYVRSAVEAEDVWDVAVLLERVERADDGLLHDWAERNGYVQGDA